MANPITPTVGRMVYYVAYGTPNGEYKPTGLFFHQAVRYSEDPIGGTWHWMPFQLGQAKAQTPT